MFDIGLQELIIIFIVALLIFGPKRLPELGKTLGKGMAELKKAMAGVKDQMDLELKDEKQALMADNDLKPRAESDESPDQEKNKAGEDEKAGS